MLHECLTFNLLTQIWHLLSKGEFKGRILLTFLEKWLLFLIHGILSSASNISCGWFRRGNILFREWPILYSFRGSCFLKLVHVEESSWVNRIVRQVKVALLFRWPHSQHLETELLVLGIRVVWDIHFLSYLVTRMKESVLGQILETSSSYIIGYM